MTYNQLIAEHNAIEAAMFVVLSQTQEQPPCPAAVTKSLETLANLLRDHLAGEDDILYQSYLRARGGRHVDAADGAMIELDRLKEDWTNYLYRWDGAAIADDWSGFAAATAAMIDRMQHRVTFETAILYSLALHHEVIAVG